LLQADARLHQNSQGTGLVVISIRIDLLWSLVKKKNVAEITTLHVFLSSMQFQSGNKQKETKQGQILLGKNPGTGLEL
jgi:hypothetical protein